MFEEASEVAALYTMLSHTACSLPPAHQWGSNSPGILSTASAAVVVASQQARPDVGGETEVEGCPWGRVQWGHWMAVVHCCSGGGWVSVGVQSHYFVAVVAVVGSWSRVAQAVLKGIGSLFAAVREAVNF